jgi:HTH-type transcriptional regulator / antitoxin HipB
MIHNERQYEVTQAKLGDLEKELAMLTPPDPTLHPHQILGRKTSLNILINELQQEIIEYDNLKSGQITDFPINSINELPIVMIKTRIVRGMTQKDLADKIGVREEQINRYEAHEYYGIEFNILQEIMFALDIRFSPVLISLREPLVSPELMANSNSMETAAGNSTLTTTSY